MPKCPTSGDKTEGYTIEVSMLGVFPVKDIIICYSLITDTSIT